NAGSGIHEIGILRLASGVEQRRKIQHRASLSEVELVDLGAADGPGMANHKCPAVVNDLVADRVTRKQFGACKIMVVSQQIPKDTHPAKKFHFAGEVVIDPADIV